MHVLRVARPPLAPSKSPYSLGQKTMVSTQCLLHVYTYFTSPLVYLHSVQCASELTCPHKAEVYAYHPKGPSLAVVQRYRGQSAFTSLSRWQTPTIWRCSRRLGQ